MKNLPPGLYKYLHKISPPILIEQIYIRARAYISKNKLAPAPELKFQWKFRRKFIYIKTVFIIQHKFIKSLYELNNNWNLGGEKNGIIYI